MSMRAIFHITQAVSLAQFQHLFLITGVPPLIVRHNGPGLWRDQLFDLCSINVARIQFHIAKHDLYAKMQQWRCRCMVAECSADNFVLF